MFPENDLNRIAARRAALQLDITSRRIQCAAGAARVAQPLAWLDQLTAAWRQLSPLAQFAVVPLGFLVQRAVFPRSSFLRLVVRWAPVALGVLRGLDVAVKCVGSAHSQATRRASAVPAFGLHGPARRPHSRRVAPLPHSRPGTQTAS